MEPVTKTDYELQIEIFIRAKIHYELSTYADKKIITASCPSSTLWFAFDNHGTLVDFGFCP